MYRVCKAHVSKATGDLKACPQENTCCEIASESILSEIYTEPLKANVALTWLCFAQTSITCCSSLDKVSRLNWITQGCIGFVAWVMLRVLSPCITGMLTSSCLGSLTWVTRSFEFLWPKVKVAFCHLVGTHAKICVITTYWREVYLSGISYCWVIVAVIALLSWVLTKMKGEPIKEAMRYLRSCLSLP